MEARHEIERLAKTYADLILRLSYARLGSAYDAQDICQTVFLKLLAKLEDDGAQFLDAEHEKAWIIRATVNACHDLQRSGWRRKVVRFDEHDDIPSGEPDPASPANGGDADGPDAVAVRTAVNRLPPKYRQAVYLHYYESLPIDEIALLTGEKKTAVAKRLSRARAKLRDLLEGGPR